MTLDRKINRRDFLKEAATVAGTAAISSIPIIHSGCKGGPADIPENPVKVNVTFFNHTQGELGHRTYEGLGGENLSIKISDLGFSGVDGSKMAVRRATGTPESLGGVVGFSKTGAAIVSFPEKNEDWEAYLMNAGADYELIENQASFTSYVYARSLTWRREDIGVSGPEEPIIEAFRQVQEAISYPWKKYGELRQDPNGAMSVGYRIQDEPAFISMGTYAPVYIRVSPEICNTDELKLKYFIQSIFRITTHSGNLGDQESHLSICNQQTGSLSPQGRDLTAYVYTMT